MWEAVTLHIKQYGQYRLPVSNNRVRSLERSPSVKKLEVKNLVGLSLSCMVVFAYCSCPFTGSESPSKFQKWISRHQEGFPALNNARSQ